MDAPPDPPADLDRWRRWVEHGGAWELLDTTESSVTLRLLTCDGGEEMERLVSEDPALVAAVRAEASAEG